jgi:hypothetical protein
MNLTKNLRVALAEILAKAIFDGSAKNKETN